MRLVITVAGLALCVVVAVGCGDQSSGGDRDSTRGDRESTATEANASDDDEFADLPVRPTDEGKSMRFEVVPSEWGRPPDMTGREDALGLGDETGAFWFMVSLRKLETSYTELSQFRDFMVESLGVAETEGLRQSPPTFADASVMGFDECERMDTVMEVTGTGGRFEVGDLMTSTAWYCLEDGIVYSVSVLDMAERTPVIDADIDAIVNGISLS